MHATAADLLVYFGACSAYTQSDEITLLFPAPAEVEGKREPIVFNGKVQKLVSLGAGYASARFLYHIGRVPFTPEERELQDRLPTAHFDARVCSVPSPLHLLVRAPSH